MTELQVEPLDPKRHDRDGFASGVESLDGYLKTQASQDLRRRANAVFVMVRNDAPTAIVGYFTLCATALAPGDVPEAARKIVPRYPLVSATLLGRLAIAHAEQGKKLGGVLLVEALRRARASSSSVGSCMVVVDAIDERAARFYAAHGFIALVDPRRLILPMQTIERLFGGTS